MVADSGPAGDPDFCPVRHRLSADVAACPPLPYPARPRSTSPNVGSKITRSSLVGSARVSLCSAGMRCGPLLDVFPTGAPGGFRLIGHLGGLAAEPLGALLEPIASCGIGLTLDFADVVGLDPLGLGVLIRLLTSSGGSAILVTNARPAIVAFIDRLLPEGQPGLLVLPAPRLHTGAQPAAS